MTPDRTSPVFFEAKYRQNPDPWSFASAPAELFRYDRILHALGTRRYRSAFEPACSVGVLTSRLATICDQVLAFDLSPTAAAQATQRCADLPNVQIDCASIVDKMPSQEVDLLMLSEVGYYFESAAWNDLLTRLLANTRPGCTVLAAHWLGTSEDHCTSGDQVHATIRAHPLLLLEHEERHEHFRLDRLVRL